MTARVSPARRWSRTDLLAAAIPASVLGAFVLLPVGTIVARALATPAAWSALAESEAGDALRLSFLAATASLLLVVVLGTPAAYLLAHADFRGRSVLDAILDLPTVLPPGVAGLGLLLVFGRRGIVGSALEPWGVEIAFTPAAVVLANAFVASPFYVRAAKAGFLSVDSELEEAAWAMGLSRARCFLTVSVPLARPALLAGATMAWARALGEFGATIMFAGSLPGVTRTAPVAIYQGMETGLDAPLALSAALVAASFAMLAAARLFSRTAA